MKNSSIQWTEDTHNFWQGCTKVSAGCAHCYAEARDKRFTGGKLWSPGAPRQRSKSFDEPLKWNKKPLVCDRCGEGFTIDHGPYCPSCSSMSVHRRRVFSLSLGDWLDDEVPIEWLADMLGVILRCQNLDFLLLTKRPENWFDRIREVWKSKVIGSDVGHFARAWMDREIRPENIWLGVSVEDQAAADKRIPILLSIPARVRFLSCEPLLGLVDFGDSLQDEEFQHAENCDNDDCVLAGGIDDCAGVVVSKPSIQWCIFGGESGPGARPCNVEWIRDGVRQCKAAGIPAFVKQLGANVTMTDGCGDCDPCLGGRPDQCAVGRVTVSCGKLRDKKGGDISEFPEDLRVREFPKSEVPA